MSDEDPCFHRVAISALHFPLPESLIADEGGHFARVFCPCSQRLARSASSDCRPQGRCFWKWVGALWAYRSGVLGGHRENPFLRSVFSAEVWIVVRVPHMNDGFQWIPWLHNG